MQLFFRRQRKRQLSYFEGFPYHSGQLSAYLNTGFNFFMLSLRSGEIVRYTPPDTEAFISWLKENKVRDVKETS